MPLYPGDIILDCGAAKHLFVRRLKRSYGPFLAPPPLSLGRWMPLQKQCEPRPAASNAPVPGLWESPSLYIPHRTPSFSSFVGFIAWILVSTTKKELDEKGGDAALPRLWYFGRSDRTNIRLPTGLVTQTFLITTILKRRRRPPIICNSNFILLRCKFPIKDVFWIWYKRLCDHW